MMSEQYPQEDKRFNLELAIMAFCEKYPQNNMKIELNIDKQKKSIKIKTELYE
jgi:hypothetical protein